MHFRKVNGYNKLEVVFINFLKDGFVTIGTKNPDSVVSKSYDRETGLSLFAMLRREYKVIKPRP